MHSKDLPTTEWWDPAWHIYDVPLSPFDDGVDHDTWWAAYQHLWLLRHIMEGTAEYIPFHYQHQLTTGAERCSCTWHPRPTWDSPDELEPDPDCTYHFPHDHQPGTYSVVVGPPVPCCCPYAQHVARMAMPARPGQRRVERILYVAATYFLINPRCIHHGEPRREWALLPWENTLGPDETQP